MLENQDTEANAAANTTPQPEEAPPRPQTKTDSNQALKDSYIPPWQAHANSMAAAKAKLERIKVRRAQNQRKLKRAKWRNRILLVSFIGFIYWFYNPHGIFVLGDPLSVGRYRGVLKDLRKELPAEYEIVKNHIDTIRIAYFIPGGNYAGYAKEGERGDKQITLLENTFVQGPGYAHSTLVHEACHGLQFEKKLPFTPFCQNQAREHACTQMALKVLRHFDAKPEMLKYYENLTQGSSVYGNSCLRNGTVESLPEL